MVRGWGFLLRVPSLLFELDGLDFWNVPIVMLQNNLPCVILL